MEKPPEGLISERPSKPENHFMTAFVIAHKNQNIRRFEEPSEMMVVGAKCQHLGLWELKKPELL